MVFALNGQAKGRIQFSGEKSVQADIAIIGLAASIGACETYREFWRELTRGTDFIGPIPEARKKAAEAILEREGTHDAEFKRLAYMPRIDQFDYHYFKYSPKEASHIDPAQRLFLQTAVTAIEDAGYGGERLRGTNTGVFVGYADVQSHSYQRITHVMDPEAVYQYPTANLNSLIPGRISYLLDLKGPALVVDTACSSSLVAVHYACQALRRGECDMALCGGVKVHLVPLKNQLNLGIESPDERAKVFDDDADGTGGGEGAAALLLKPLDAAIADGDHIYAVIKGSGVNQDGTSVGITAPNVFAQEEVIVSAWEDAGIDPETITYIETHGTGTRLGDPIEIRGIERAFARFTRRKQFCGVGALKSNIGHLDHAAGIAGLVKAVFCLKHRMLPPNLHFRVPNREISFIDSPVYVIDRLRPWTVEPGQPRRCGVSSFGLSGTNCHLVLEEAPPAAGTDEAWQGEQLFAVSGRSREALLELIAAYARFFGENDGLNLADVCHTANAGRGHYEHRVIARADSLPDLTAKLEAVLANPDDNLEHLGVYTTFARGPEGSPYDLSFSDSRIVGVRMDSLTREQADELCRQYVDGVDLDWERLYAGTPRRKISLPTYTFEKMSCWVAETSGSEDAEAPGHFYGRRWEPAPLKPGNAPVGDVLIFRHRWEEPEQWSSISESGNGRIVLVQRGNVYERTGDLNFTIGDGREDCERCLADIGGLGLNLTHIVYLADLPGADDGTIRERYADAHALRFFVKALVDSRLAEDADFMLVTRHAHRVSGEETGISTANALLASMLKAMKAEHGHLRFRSIDIGSLPAVDAIRREMTAPREGFVHLAHRDGIRYKETIARIDANELELDDTAIRPGGVYVVTGGTGIVGTELCRYLASRERVRLVILQRTLPDFTPGDGSRPTDVSAGLAERLTELERLVGLGSTVEIMRVDVTSDDEVRRAIGQIRRKYGAVHGIVHAAGVGVGGRGDKFLVDEDSADIEAMLAPKLAGTLLLDKHTRQEPPDFMLLCSSAVTLVGGFCVGKYLMANAFLDAFSEQRNLSGLKTIAVNWPTWRPESAKAAAADGKMLFRSIRPTEARAGLHRILNRKVSHAVIGQFNWTSEIHQISATLPYTLSGGLRMQLDNYHRKKATRAERTLPVVLKGKESFTETERQLAAVWSDLLGLHEIDVNDAFTDLGGDSILMVRLEMELEKLQLKTEDLAIYRYPTIARLAEHIDNLKSREVVQ